MTINEKQKLVQGWGINDAKYSVWKDGKIIPEYNLWKGILQRCFDPKEQARRPPYKGCTVDARWQKFTDFRAWMATQDWRGKQIDKDILQPGNKIYGPDTCRFVTSQVNSLLVDAAAIRGDHPLGVDFHTDTRKFRASIGFDGARHHLGLFTDPLCAHNVYLRAKVDIIAVAAIGTADPEIKEALRWAAYVFQTAHMYGDELTSWTEYSAKIWDVHRSRVKTAGRVAA